MTVQDDVRAAEAEIDDFVASLPLWQCGQTEVVRGVLDHYAQALEAHYLHLFWLQTYHSNRVQEVRATEEHLHISYFWAVKWALTMCPKASSHPVTDDAIASAVGIALAYQTLVDALKFASHDLLEIRADHASKTLTVFEGGAQTANDQLLDSELKARTPISSHTQLTKNADQLTSQWSAGDYRRLGSQFCDLLDQAEVEELVCNNLDGTTITIAKRPIVVDFQALATESPVVKDLTVSSDRLRDGGIWEWTSFRDTPLVDCGPELLGVSSLVRASCIGAGDDYMLRLASRSDPEQYSTVSGLREPRMVNYCREILESQGWSVDSSVQLTNPAQEIDIVATRDKITLVLELKSTLRPESPWEVHNRNQDILKGLEQAALARARTVKDATAVLITDGYLGDYPTWKRSLDLDIPLLPLSELSMLAQDSNWAGMRLSRLRESSPNHGTGALLDREGQIGQWTIIVRDEASR